MGYVYPEESKELIRIAMQLHRELGCGFKEKVYQDAFEVLLKENGIPYEREKHLALTFHGVVLEHDFYYDFFCYGKIGVELKAMSEILGEHESQVINYIHVGNHRLGILFNFGSTSLQYKCYPNRIGYRSNNPELAKNSQIRQFVRKEVSNNPELAKNSQIRQFVRRNN